MEGQINYIYVISWVLAATLGMFVFGYSLSSFNIMTNFMYYHYKYNNTEGFYMEDINLFNSIITSVVPIGAAFGALVGGKLASNGRRDSAILLSIASAFGSLLTIVQNFYFLVIGRLVIGFTSGAMSVVAPMLVSEISPVSISGSLGACNQIMVTLGIMIVNCFGFLIPQKDNVPEQKNSILYVYIFLIPAAISLIQAVLFQFVFKYDTPVFYQKRNQTELQNEVNKLIYKDYLQNNSDMQCIEPIYEEGYTDLISNAYRKAFLIGCCLSMVQQLTGINCIIFYSTDIFTKNASGNDAESAAKFGTFLVGFINCISSVCVLPLLNYFGRKSLLLFGQHGMILCYFLLSISSAFNMNLFVKILTLLFVCFFEFGVGTILWVYASEIMTAKGMGIAILLNWIITIVWSFSTPFMFSWFSPQYIYGFLMILCLLGAIFIHINIIETKGLSRVQIDQKLNDYYNMEEKNSPNEFDSNELGDKREKNSNI